MRYVEDVLWEVARATVRAADRDGAAATAGVAGEAAMHDKVA